jgi:hypothetical protein
LTFILTDGRGRLSGWAALFGCAPNDLRPLPAFRLKLVAEVIFPGSRKA